MKKVSIILICSTLIVGFASHAQEKLYPDEFPLSDVKLLDGPFKHARDLNIHVLLEYDIDRLIAPFRKEAGLPEKAKLFPNWEGLDGHVRGHYLTALAMNYVSTGNAECKKRMEYMISELKACQDSNDKFNPDWGIGYVGGVPASKRIWSTLQKGDEVQVFLPMHNSIEKMPSVPNYIAILHGPILLGAKTGSEDVKGLIADDIHDSRYMIYWMWLTELQYKTYIDSLATVEKERIELQKRTIDFVSPGEQQPEVDHQIEKQKSNTGNIAGAVYDIRLVRK